MDDWDDRPHTSEEIEAKLLSRKEAALKREKALVYAFSHKVCSSSQFVFGQNLGTILIP